MSGQDDKDKDETPTDKKLDINKIGTSGAPSDFEDIYHQSMAGQANQSPGKDQFTSGVPAIVYVKTSSSPESVYSSIAIQTLVEQFNKYGVKPVEKPVERAVVKNSFLKEQVMHNVTKKRESTLGRSSRDTPVSVSSGIPGMRSIDKMVTARLKDKKKPITTPLIAHKQSSDIIELGSSELDTQVENLAAKKDRNSADTFDFDNYVAGLGANRVDFIDPWEKDPTARSAILGREIKKPPSPPKVNRERSRPKKDPVSSYDIVSSME